MSSATSNAEVEPIGDLLITTTPHTLSMDSPRIGGVRSGGGTSAAVAPHLATASFHGSHSHSHSPQPYPQMAYRMPSSSSTSTGFPSHHHIHLGGGGGGVHARRESFLYRATIDDREQPPFFANSALFGGGSTTTAPTTAGSSCPRPISRASSVASSDPQ